MRRAAKVDENHSEIVRVLRKMGAMVVDCSRMGQGFPDLNVVYRYIIAYVEIKDGSKSPSARKLTPDQVAFHTRCLLHGVKVHIVTSVEDAVQFMAMLGK